MIIKVFEAIHEAKAGGEILTRPMTLDGTRLHLNAKCDYGEIVVEVVVYDPYGKEIRRGNGTTPFTLTASVIIQGDHEVLINLTGSGAGVEDIEVRIATPTTIGISIIPSIVDCRPCWSICHILFDSNCSNVLWIPLRS